jgi:ribonuclease HI
MELFACIEGIKQVMRRTYFNKFDNVAIHTDSQYIYNHIYKAIYEWSNNQWLNKQGSPIANAELWKDLVRILKALYRKRKHFTFYWVKGHSKSKNNRAADKLAKKSAEHAYKPPLNSVKVRRKLSSESVEVGCIPMLNQIISIHVITECYLKIQKLYKYKYEIISTDSPYLGKIDIIFSELETTLRAGHYYSVKLNGQSSNPRIVEVLEELPKEDKVVL